jgi:hypothetical protein
MAVRHAGFLLSAPCWRRGNSNFNANSHLQRLPIFLDRRNSLIFCSGQTGSGTKLAHGFVEGFEVRLLTKRLLTPFSPFSPTMIMTG